MTALKTSRVYQRCGQRAYGDNVEDEHAVLAVEEDRDELLAIGGFESCPKRLVDCAAGSEIPESTRADRYVDGKARCPSTP